jgi:hypothetical protein
MLKRAFFFLLVALVGAGCPSTREVPKKRPEQPLAAPAMKKPPAPGIIVRFASLDISKFPRKIEAPDIERLAAALWKDTVEIFALQGITRYPELKNRIDILQELAARAEMRSTFGETIFLSGHLGGNAVFSSFPIRSSENTHYDRIRSTNFEAALQALIDCGMRDVLVVSTQIPEKASDEDQSICSSTLASFSNLYFNNPVIIAGNLPRAEAVRAMAQYNEPPGTKPADAPRIWFSGDGSLKLLGIRYENTALGRMAVAEFGIFPRKNP